MEGFQALMLPQQVLWQELLRKQFQFQSQHEKRKSMVATSTRKGYDLEYYVKAALAGGICTGITHGALT